MPSRRSANRPRFPKPLFALAAAVFLALALGGAGLFTASKLEEQDAFCASCHSQPEATYFSREAAAEVDLASLHARQKQARCIDCHSSSGLGGRLAAMQVGVNDLIPWVTGTARQPAPLTVPIRDENCLKCHRDTPQTDNFNRHFHALLSRWQSADPQAATCVECHSAHTTDGESALGFLQRDRTVAVCNRCHSFAGVD